MKQIYLTLISLLLITLSHAQQSPWYLAEYLESSDTCDFSDTCSFIQIDTSSHWEVGGTNKPYFSDNFTGNGIMTDTLDFYCDADTSYFQLDFTGMLNYYDDYGGQALSVEFTHKMQTDTLKDGGFITISLDSGQTWQNVADMDENPWGADYEGMVKHNIYGISDTLFNGEKGFSGTFEWKTSGIQIIFMFPLKSLNTDPMMRFNFISDSNASNKEGWIIDSLIIAEQYLGSNLDEFHSDQLKMAVYPNPSGDVVNVESTEKGRLLKGNLHLLDISGKQLFTKEVVASESIQLDVSAYQAGIYVVRWTDWQGKQVEKKVIIE